MEKKRHVFKIIKKDKQVGAINGALNSKNDPKGKRRAEFAEMFYKEVIARNRRSVINRLSKNSGFDKETTEEAFNHLFIEKHDLMEGYKTFDPDYYMAQSIQRLLDGKDIRPYDKLLIGHEAEESRIMHLKKISYDNAHKLANMKYNYEKALEEYKSKGEK